MHHRLAVEQVQEAAAELRQAVRAQHLQPRDGLAGEIGRSLQFRGLRGPLRLVVGQDVHDGVAGLRDRFRRLLRLRVQLRGDLESAVAQVLRGQAARGGREHRLQFRRETRIHLHVLRLDPLQPRLVILQRPFGHRELVVHAAQLLFSGLQRLDGLAPRPLQLLRFGGGGEPFKLGAQASQLLLDARGVHAGPLQAVNIPGLRHITRQRLLLALRLRQTVARRRGCTFRLRQLRAECFHLGVVGGAEAVVAPLAQAQPVVLHVPGGAGPIHRVALQPVDSGRALGLPLQLVHGAHQGVVEGAGQHAHQPRAHRVLHHAHLMKQAERVLRPARHLHALGHGAVLKPHPEVAPVDPTAHLALALRGHQKRRRKPAEQALDHGFPLGVLGQHVDKLAHVRQLAHRQPGIRAQLRAHLHVALVNVGGAVA